MQAIATRVFRVWASRAGPTPTHCTSDAAIRQFREAYGHHCIAGGVGTVVEAPKPRPGE
jgi:hypothetical protein